MRRLSISHVSNLRSDDAERLIELIEVFNYHIAANEKKARYYEGHIPLSEVNLGIALPRSFYGLEIGCEWAGKAVDVLASRSMFDGFVSQTGAEHELLARIVADNRMIAEYQKACRDELKFGCVFATLSADEQIGCKIRFHSPMTAAGLWSGEKGRIDCGMSIIDTAPDEKATDTYSPSIIRLDTDTDIIMITRTDSKWIAEYHPHIMGRPLIEPLIYNATSSKPFGRSRIKEPIRRLIQGYVRTIANATIGLEFATAPQKYILGVTDEQYDAIVDSKFAQYVGNILAATTNPETGSNPVFGQLQQGSLEPHVQMLRVLATQFSAASGLSVTDTGVVNDANPTSSEAIMAQTQTLILMAEQLNSSNGDSLNAIARMAQAIIDNVSLSDLDEEGKAVIAHFKNPAMPSVSATSDAAMKIATAREGFGDTDTFLEMIGFDQADIRRIKAQEQRARGMRLLAEEFSDADDSNRVETI